MKKLLKGIFILIIIFSLGLNVILLNERKNYSNDCEAVDIKDITKDEDNKTKNIKLTKDEFTRQFKEYQSKSKLANSDAVVVWDVTKLIEVGYFKSNETKKLYYVTEKYSCMEGTDCVKASGKVDTDAEYNNVTTFVVAATPVDETSTIFEILDYSIEKNDDFQKINPVEVK